MRKEKGTFQAAQGLSTQENVPIEQWRMETHNRNDVQTSIYKERRIKTTFETSTKIKQQLIKWFKRRRDGWHWSERATLTRWVLKTGRKSVWRSSRAAESSAPHGAEVKEDTVGWGVEGGGGGEWEGAAAAGVAMEEEVRQLWGSFQSAQEDLEFELLERPGAQRNCRRTWVGAWLGFRRSNEFSASTIIGVFLLTTDTSCVWDKRKIPTIIYVKD